MHLASRWSPVAPGMADGLGRHEPAAGLIGRGAELAAVLDRVLTAAPEPQVVLIQGEAGIGKTVLFDAVLESLRREAGVVLEHRAVAAEATASFSGLVDLLGVPDSAALAGLAPPRRHALEVALRLVPPGASPPDRTALGLAVRDALLAITAGGRIAVAIDDVQWLDRSSAEVLAFAMARLQGVRARLLAAARTPVATPVPLVEALGTRVRIERQVIGALSLGSIFQLLRRETGVELARPQLVRLAQATGGNPLHVLEAGRALGGRQPLAPGEPFPAPDDLAALLVARLRRLPDDAREVVAAAALLARPTRAILIAALGRAPVLAAMQLTAEAGILVEGGSTLRFGHPLFASVALDALDPQALRALHARLAAVVTEPEARARHAALASEPSEGSAGALDDAADLARRRGATSTAGELLELAASATPRTDPAGRRRRIIAAAEAYRLAGNREHSRTILATLLAEPSLSRSERVDVRFGIARARRMALPEVVEGLEAALADVEADDPRAVDILAYLSWMRALRGSVHGALDAATEALARAEQLGDEVRTVRAIARLAQARLLALEIDPCLLERGVALEEALPSDAARLEFHESPSITQTQYLVRAGAFDACRSRLLELAERASARGDEGTHAQLRFHLTQLETYAGRWAEAMQHAAAGLELGEQLEDEQFHGLMLATAARAHAYRGDLAVAASMASAALEAARRVGDGLFDIDARTVLATIALVEDRTDDAVELVADVPGRLLAGGYRDPMHHAWLPAAEALIRDGQLDEAAGLLETWRGLAERSRSPRARGAVGLATAWWHAARGDHAAALEAADAAIERFSSYPAPFDLARSMLARADALRMLRRVRDARSSAREAAERFDALGAAPWARQARGLVHRLGADPRSSGVLTPAQHRVVELVVEARSNKEVAAQLGISINTVEAHLAAAFRRLGIDSRAELIRRWPASTAPHGSP